MNMKQRLKIKGQITRLRVFSYIKKRVESNRHIGVIGDDVARALGISSNTAIKHMRALSGATGIKEFVYDNNACYASNDGVTGVQHANFSLNKTFDENYIPVDVLVTPKE